jgi:hypothetical protein
MMNKRARFVPTDMLDKEFFDVVDQIEKAPSLFLWGLKNGYGIFNKRTYEKVYFTTDRRKAAVLNKNLIDYGFRIEKQIDIPF